MCEATNKCPRATAIAPWGRKWSSFSCVVVVFVGLGLVVVFLGRERRHVNVESGTLFSSSSTISQMTWPSIIALLDRGIVLDALFDGLGHGGFGVGLDFDGPQQPFAGGRDRQIVAGDHRHPLPEVGDELLFKIDLRTVGIVRSLSRVSFQRPLDS